MKRFFLALSALAALSVANSSAQVTVINSLPYTIYNAGYYTLAHDLSIPSVSENGITIANAQDVILDLGGFAIIHSGTGGCNGAAIAIVTTFPSAATTHNVVIRNGTISKGNSVTTPFGTGVSLSKAYGCTVDNVIIGPSTTAGISDTSGFDNKFSNCQIDGGGYGVYLNGCTDDAVIGNDIAGCGWGVFSTGSNGTMVVNNYIQGNSLQGNSQSHGMSLSPTDVYWADFFPGIKGEKVVGGIHGEP